MAKGFKPAPTAAPERDAKEDPTYVHSLVVWALAILYAAASLFFGTDAKRFPILSSGGLGAAAGLLALSSLPLPTAPHAGLLWQWFALAASVFFTHGYFFFQWMPARPIWRAVMVVAWAGHTTITEWLLAIGLGAHWHAAAVGQTFLALLVLFSALIGLYETLDVRARLKRSSVRRGLWSWSWPGLWLASLLCQRLAQRLTR